jgi:predicted AlkP superfamily phosphohydrolase/phosphomutase
VRLRFDTGFPGGGVMAAAGVPTRIWGNVRFHLQEVHPHLRLYVSPVNIDPADPVSPVSEPVGFAREIAEEHGAFYTVGIPEDTKALTHGALSEEAFLQQAMSVLDERAECFRRTLTRFDRGCLVSYFGTSDLVQHMFWRDRDPGHPGRLPEQGNRYARVIEDLYARLDEIVANALTAMRDEDTLIVLSDHGFGSFRRQVAVNRWLAEEGYMRLVSRRPRGEDDMFADTDWTGTRAYAMGINSLFVNLRGREKYGIVPASGRRALIDELATKLLGLRDEDGTQVVDRVDVVESVYPDADPAVAPDLVVGYAEGYRSSWGTALGAVREPLLTDNLDRWSGDHCIAQHRVPGILITSRRIQLEDPALWDIAPTVLDLFGLPTPVEMRGHPLFREGVRSVTAVEA